MRLELALSAAAVAALIAGCALGPAYQRPAIELPSAWTDVSSQGNSDVGSNRRNEYTS